MLRARGNLGIRSALAALGAGLLSMGCGSSNSTTTDATPTSEVISELRSDVARLTPAQSEVTAAAASEQEFAVSFLHALDPNENIAFSPHSLSTAFAMLTDAAEGQTLAEIEQALSFGTADEGFHRSQDALQLGLVARNREAIQNEQAKADAQILSASNDIWVREDVPPTPAYLDTLARYYGVGVHVADFPAHAEEARSAINSKVSTDTHALIRELLPKKSITDDTVLVLTNAMYFKAPWSTPFGGPTQGQFHSVDGLSSPFAMLRAIRELRYYAGDGFVSVALPYYGGDLELLLIVPDVGAYETVRGALSSELLTQMVTAGTTEAIDLTLPKFTIKSVVPAAATLKSLGIVTAFDKDLARFPAFASALYDNVYVSDVLHQATVAIDERGTEASAATAIVLGGIVLGPFEEPPPPKVVVADHPFLFVIRDNPTGSVLFVGQVVAP